MKLRVRLNTQVQKTAFIFLAVFSLQLVMSPALFSISVKDQVFTGEDEEDPLDAKTTTGNDSSGSVADETRRTTEVSSDELQSKTRVVMADRVPYKDPRLSCLLSFIIPGGGEFYLRNDIKGLTFCLTTTTAYLLSFYYLYQSVSVGGSDARNKLITGSIGFVTAVIVHIVGMVESYNDAVEINEARYYYSE